MHAYPLEDRRAQLEVLTRETPMFISNCAR
jgi:hypothetical protein